MVMLAGGYKDGPQMLRRLYPRVGAFISVIASAMRSPAAAELDEQSHANAT